MLCMLRTVGALSYSLVAISLALGPAQSQAEEPRDRSCLKAYARVAAALGIEADTAEARVQTKRRPLAPWLPFMKSVKVVTTAALRVEVEEETDQVTFVRNEVDNLRTYERKRRFRSSGKLSIPTRHPSAIIATVEEFFARVAGRPMPNDLRLRVVEFEPKRGVWNLGWARYIAGYLSDDEGVGASVDDVSGKILHYGYTVTGATCRPIVRLSLKDAAQTAQKHAEHLLQKQAGGEPYDIYEREPASLQIVYPNYAKTKVAETLAEEDLRKASKNPRLAFVFQFGLRYTGTKEAYTMLPLAIIWIDAENGKVLGGL